MTSMGPEDIPALHPAIAAFDEHNELLAYVADMSIGALQSDELLFRSDKADAYFDAISVLRSREAGPLRRA